jgi:hypothetical protein
MCISIKYSLAVDHHRKLSTLGKLFILCITRFYTYHVACHMRHVTHKTVFSMNRFVFLGMFWKTFVHANYNKL